jgi:hypothetical protein
MAIDHTAVRASRKSAVLPSALHHSLASHRERRVRYYTSLGMCLYACFSFSLSHTHTRSPSISQSGGGGCFIIWELAGRISARTYECINTRVAFYKPPPLMIYAGGERADSRTTFFLRSLPPFFNFCCVVRNCVCCANREGQDGIRPLAERLWICGWWTTDSQHAMRFVRPL